MVRFLGLILALNVYADTFKVMVIDSGIANIGQLKPYLKAYRPIDLMPWHDHGTHIAGIIAKQACPGVEIISCMGISFKVDYKASEECFKLAKKLRVDVVNYSGGGDFPEAIEKAAIFDYLKEGLLIAAAGNENRNLATHPYYPASYMHPKIKVIGNLKQNGYIAKKSNYGPGIIWEIGEKIESWNVLGEKEVMSGTSQAAAVHTAKIVEGFCNGKR